MKSNDEKPESLIQRQLEAYNKRDLDALMATYAPDAQQFDYPSKLLASGAEQIRSRFAERFREPNLHAHLNHRIVLGATVLDHETITRSFPEGAGEIDIVAIYEVGGGKITRATFVFGEKRIAVQ
jgi:hypothetical protein